MNIQVRVIAAQAQKQLAATRGQVTALDRAANASGRGVGALGGQLSSTGKHMVAFGSQTQWTGRILMRNFTLPLALAGAAAAKFALDNEKAFVRIEKVYGDGSAQMNQLAEKELPALKRAFEALSNEYGVQQKEVLQIAGDWAAAGASGIQLAHAVEVTMKAMVLGEMEAGKATESLIAIQAQYGQDTEGLIRTLNTLNMVENQTGISLSGLVDGMSRAAGVARSSGIDVQHLAAMMAALVPAAGSATNAGNALKTIISRVMSPTQEASQVLAEMGIKMDENSWKSKNAAQRLVYLAHEYKKLGEGVSKNTAAVDENGDATGQMISAQQAVASTVLASRWQINRFDVLMREMTSETGYYARALEATASEERNAAQAAKELDAVLSSSPRRLQQMGVILQNSLANIIQPLIPLLIGFAAEIARMARAFSNLSPFVQKLVIVILGMLAVFGPLLVFFGSLVASLGVLGKMFGPVVLGAATLGARLVWMATGPFALAARGATAMGAAVLASSGFFVKFINGLRYMAAASLASSGILGMAARKVVGAIIFMRTTALVNLLAMRLAFLYTMQQMALAAGAWFARNMLTSFGATMTRMYLLMQASLGAMLVRWATAWAQMYANTVMYLVAMQAAAIKRVGAMLIAMNVTLAGHSARWSALWATRIVAPVLGLATLMNARLLGGMVATFARLLVATAAYGAASSGMWGRMMAHLYRINTVIYLAILKAFYAFQVAMTVANVAFQTAFRAVWVAGMAATTAVWTGTLVVMRRIFAVALFNMRAMWMMFAVFLRSPAVIMGMVAMMGRGMALAVRVVRMGALAMAAAMASPITLAVGVILLALYVFREQIAQVFSNLRNIPASVGSAWVQTARGLTLPWYNLVSAIAGAFNKLPQSVQNAMIAVVNVVKRAAMAVYELFSYLNPFARHSPSLVDNVTAGMAVVGEQFDKAASKSSGLVGKARRDLAAFRKMVEAMGGGKFADERKDISEANPGAVKAFDKMVRSLGPLNAALNSSRARMDAQESVVKKWDRALESANDKLDAQRDILDDLQDNLQALEQTYDSAKDRLDKFAEAPIKGMSVYNDKLFENEMAQKKLRLEMMKWEDANGNFQETKDQLAMLQGSIENLQGSAKNMRQGGAGSDVLGPVNAEISKMQAEYTALEKGLDGSPMKAMNKEMKRLQKESEMLDLEKAIKYDPLTRQIEQLVNAQKELAFDDIVAGVNKEKAAMAALEPQIAAATTAVKAQEGAVKAADAAREAISDTYDIENAKLSALKDAYSEIEDTIRDVEAALRDMGGAASTALMSNKSKEGYVSPGLQNFRDAAGGAFPDPGASNLIGDRGLNPVDESGLIDQFALDSAAKLEAAMGDLSLTGPFKRAWERVKTWWNAYITPFFEPLRNVWDGVVASVDWGAPFEKLFQNDKVESAGEALVVVWKRIKDGVQVAVDVVKAIIALFAPDVERIFNQIVQFVRNAIDQIGPELAAFGPMIGPFFEALRNIAVIVGGLLLGLAKVVISVLGHTIGPIFDTVVGIIKNAVSIIRGILKVLIGIFTLDVGMALDGLVDIFGGAFGLIGTILGGAVKIIVGIVKGLVGGIVGFFKWLYDVLVGHSIIPDLVAMVIKVFKMLLPIVKWINDYIIQPLFKGFVWLKDKSIEAANFLKDKFMAGIKLLLPIVAWVLTNIVNPGLRHFETFRDKAKSAAETLKNKVMDSIKALLPIIQWIKTNIVNPAVSALGSIWEATKPALNRLLRGIANIFNGLGKGITAGINGGLKAIDKLIDGLNWIGKNVPGLSFTIGATTKYTYTGWTAPQYAKGGELPWSEVGGGFKTSGPRAIVGEGSRSHAEYVIPTDPKHRGRARGLLKLAAGDLDVPLYAAGGILDKIRNGAKNVSGAALNGFGEVKDFAGNLVNVMRKGAVMAAMAAPLKIFDEVMKNLDPKPRPMKDLINHKKNDVYNWMKGVDESAGTVGEEQAKAAAATQVSGGRFGGVGNGATGLHPRFLAMWNSFNASQGNRFSIGSGWRSSAQQARLYDRWVRRVPGQAPAAPPGRSNHERGLAIDHTPHSTAASRAAAAQHGLRYPMSYEPWHIEPINLQALKGKMPLAAKGGILNGPAVAIAGEAGREVLSPLAPLWSRFDRLEHQFEGRTHGSDGGATIIINGDLSFPNITSGDDADAFITNLEIMARK